LKIPLLIANDVIHGYRTIFPIPLAEAASWDPQLVERAARVAAREAAAAGTHWTFAPMVDVARDPRWGRVAEGSGEDPFLGSALAVARVRGFQGRDLGARDTVLACAKHFAAYGAPEAGRDYNTVDVSRRTLREVYLPPFRAAVDAGVRTVMTAFNEIAGVPATASPFLLRQVLRREWGFQGFVVSDWKSVLELVNHGVAGSAREAARLALEAGVDMDMQGATYPEHLVRLVREGTVGAKLVDDAVRRVLRAKLELGLFERPYADPALEKEVTLSAEHRAAALEMARRSIVLLKNDGDLLPLDPARLKRVALLGPLSADRRELLGSWQARGKAEEVVTVLDALRARLTARTRLVQANGCTVESCKPAEMARAVALARGADVALLVVGERAEMSGEAASRVSLDLPGDQAELVRRVQASGTPVVLVLMNGRPLVLTDVIDRSRAVLEAWFLGSEAGNAIAEALLGAINPGGKLPISFPRAVGQVPIYYAHKNTGRPPGPERFSSKYLDVSTEPLFPFGFGLSYTRFELRDLKPSATTIPRSGTLEVTVELANVGKRSGDEVVQLYLRDLVATVTRPVRQLAGFQRVRLAAGEKRTLRFRVGPDQLGFVEPDGRLVVEPGAFQIWVGSSSKGGLTARFEVR
jgi:beta-glucosidase